jgi:hypothetical protein
MASMIGILETLGVGIKFNPLFRRSVSKLVKTFLERFKILPLILLQGYS